MSNFKPYYFLFALITLIFSCKKDDVEVIEPDPDKGEIQQVNDSLSFNIGSEKYVLVRSNSRGIGNRQINLKPFNDKIPGREAAAFTAGKYYYGEIDSTLYCSYFGMVTNTDDRSSAELIFTKKFSLREVHPFSILLIPKDQSQVIKVGKQSFATDFSKENTKDGIVLNLYINGNSLTSTVPGFSIAMQSQMKDIQKDSSFEITKVEKVEGDIYMLEAKFTMNVFDEEEKLYRVENGYLRKRFNMSLNVSQGYN